VFERFTERARQVVVLAQDESRRLGHDFIGTEHLLLALIGEEEGLAARVLAGLGVTLEQGRAAVVRRLGEGQQVATGQIPFTAAAKQTLELSLREALSLGHNYISTEHLLLGLVRVRDDAALEILVDLGIERQAIEHEVIRMIGAPSPSMPHPADTGRIRSRWVLSPAYVSGWLFFGAALAIGVLVGWLIWG
jgi:ATP-dependent Clp protease ATP-binding subunit ClpC